MSSAGAGGASSVQTLDESLSPVTADATRGSLVRMGSQPSSGSASSLPQTDSSVRRFEVTPADPATLNARLATGAHALRIPPVARRAMITALLLLAFLPAFWLAIYPVLCACPFIHGTVPLPLCSPLNTRLAVPPCAHAAAFFSDVHELKTALDEGADVNSRDAVRH